MFATLKENLVNTFDKLKSKGFLTEDDINKAMREVRIILLEADVALPVAKNLINRVKEKALGEKVLKSVTPGQMIFKIFHDELEHTLGESAELRLLSNPTVIMIAGLQGSGKTTTSAKLALHLRKTKNKKVLMASADIYRPAAQKQLEVLGKQIGISTTEIVEGKKPEAIARDAFEEAKRDSYNVLILDTAGRIHTDQELMDELVMLKKVLKPAELLLVADSLTGQDAVNIAQQFNDTLDLTGVILTRVDGDARGGAALSMAEVTGSPIKFIGVGEKMNELEVFQPKRAAGRILDKGDVVSLVEKASEMISEDEAASLQKKLEQGKFDMDDLLKQLKNLKRMGGIGKMLGMVPGMKKIKDQVGQMDIGNDAFKKQESIIQSMTLKERRDPEILNGSRRKRIAFGSGTSVNDVNQLMNRFKQMQGMMRKMKGGKLGNMKKMFDM